MENQSKGLAIANLVLGIIAIILNFCIGIFGIVFFAVVGLILGIIALTKKQCGMVLLRV